MFDWHWHGRRDKSIKGINNEKRKTERKAKFKRVNNET